MFCLTHDLVDEQSCCFLHNLRYWKSRDYVNCGTFGFDFILLRMNYWKEISFGITATNTVNKFI